MIDRQAVACAACQLSSRRKLRQVHRSNTERKRGTCLATCTLSVSRKTVRNPSIRLRCVPPHVRAVAPQTGGRCHGSLSVNSNTVHPFALCSPTCTRSRSPNWHHDFGVVASRRHETLSFASSVQAHTSFHGRCHGHRSPFPAGCRSRTVQHLRSETVNGDEREQRPHSPQQAPHRCAQV